jgi:hypothetical protein
LGLKNGVFEAAEGLLVGLIGFGGFVLRLRRGAAGLADEGRLGLDGPEKKRFEGWVLGRG